MLCYGRNNKKNASAKKRPSNAYSDSIPVSDEFFCKAHAEPMMLSIWSN